VDLDSGCDFTGYEVIRWAAELDIYFIRPRLYKKNDQATIESENNQIVRRYGFYWRYDTPVQLRLLNELWPLVNDRHNCLTATNKPTDWTTDSTGRRKLIDHTLTTPFDRLLRSGALTPGKPLKSPRIAAPFNPTDIAREIDRIQQRLNDLVAKNTPPSRTSNSQNNQTRTLESNPPERRRNAQAKLHISRAFLCESPERFRGHA
jgi:hypothetical protein